MGNGKGDDVDTDQPPLWHHFVDLVSWLCEMTLADGPLIPDAPEPVLVRGLRMRTSLGEALFQKSGGVGVVLRAEAIGLARVLLESDVQRLLLRVTEDGDATHDQGFVWAKELWERLGSSRTEHGHFHENEGLALIRAYARWSLYSLRQADMDWASRLESKSVPTTLVREAFSKISSLFQTFQTRLLLSRFPPPQWLKAVMPEVICHLLANADGQIRDRGVAYVNNSRVWFKAHEAPSTAWKKSPRDICFGIQLHALLRSKGPNLPVRWALSAVKTLSTARSFTTDTQARQWRSRAGLLTVLSSLFSRQPKDLCVALAAWSCYRPLLHLIRTALVDGCTEMETLSDDDYLLLLHVISISSTMSEKVDRQSFHGGAKPREVKFRQQLSSAMEDLLTGPLAAAQQGCATGSLMYSRRHTVCRGLRDSADRLQNNCAPRPLTTKSGSYAAAPRRVWLNPPRRRSVILLPDDDPPIQRLSSLSSSNRTLPEASDEDKILRGRQTKLDQEEERLRQFYDSPTEWLQEETLVSHFVGTLLKDELGNPFDDPCGTLGCKKTERDPEKLRNTPGDPVNSSEASPESMVWDYLSALLCEVHDDLSNARREYCPNAGTLWTNVQSIEPVAGGIVMVLALSLGRGPETQATREESPSNAHDDYVPLADDFVSIERAPVYGEQVQDEYISAWVRSTRHNGALIEVFVQKAMLEKVRSWFNKRVVLRLVMGSVSHMRQVRALCNLKRLPFLILLAFWCPSMYLGHCDLNPKLREPGKAVSGSVITAVNRGESRDARCVKGVSVTDVTTALPQGRLTMNESQRAAVRAIVRVPEEDGEVCKSVGVQIIQGPPGTGKSRTIITMLMALLTVDPGARVLICAQTNNAVNNLAQDALPLLRTLGLQEAAPVRVGKVAADVDECVHLICLQRLQRTNPGKSASGVINCARVVFCTLSGAGNNKVFGRNATPFTHMFADEAAQATVPHLLVPLVNCGIRLAALVGDPAQLPATVTSSNPVARQILRRSLHHQYEQALSGSKHPHLFLNTQYRMTPLLSEFPRCHFYGNELRDAQKSVATAASHVRDYHRDAEKRFWVLSVYDLSGCKAWAPECKDGCTGSWSNRGEAQLVSAVLESLCTLYRDETTKNIVVLTPYLAQVKALTTAIVSACPKDFVVPVMTIDAYQGREADIVVLSTVRTTSDGGSIGFLDSPQRQNVALTRGRRSLIIVAAVDALSQSATWSAYFQWAKNHKDVKTFPMCSLLVESGARLEVKASMFPEIGRPYV